MHKTTQKLTLCIILYLFTLPIFAQTMTKTIQNQWFSSLTEIKGSNQSMFPISLTAGHTQYEEIIVIGAQAKEIPTLLHNTPVFRMRAVVQLNKDNKGKLTCQTATLYFVTHENKNYENEALYTKVVQLLKEASYDIFMRQGAQLEPNYQLRFFVQRKLK